MVSCKKKKGRKSEINKNKNLIKYSTMINQNKEDKFIATCTDN